jgi:ferredoxin
LGVCEPECPWEAIFLDHDVPDAFEDDIALNARTVERPSSFAVPDEAEKPAPSPEQVRANNRRWGFAD